MHVYSVDVLVEQVRWKHLPQSRRKSLVSLQLGVNLLRGEDGSAVGEGDDVAGVEELGVPAWQHLQSVLLHQHFPDNISC